MKKEKIKVKIDDVSVENDFFDGDLGDVIDRIHSLKALYGNKGYTDLFFERRYDYEWSEPELFGTRLENDKEFNARKKVEEAKLVRAELKLEKERQKYLKLKEKFEPKT
jgi:hypothetical protein